MVQAEQGIQACASQLIFHCCSRRLFESYQQVLMNFSVGLVIALVTFVVGLWSIVRSYQPNPIVAVFFFVAAACAAFSFVATYLIAMYGAAAGGIYGVLKVAENNLRLQQGQQPRHMHNRPHYD